MRQVLAMTNLQSLNMGKHRYLNCVTCNKSIRSNAMARHARGCSTIQVRAENGRFAGRAARPVKAAARLEEAAARPVQEAARLEDIAALPVAPLLVEAAPPVQAAARPGRHRSPSPPIFLLQPMRCEYLSQQSDVRVSGHSKKRSKAILKRH